MTPEDWIQHLRKWGWKKALYKEQDIMVIYSWQQTEALREWGRDKIGPTPFMRPMFGGCEGLYLCGNGIVLRNGMECLFKGKHGGVIDRVVGPYGAEGGMLCWYSYKLKSGTVRKDTTSSPGEIQPLKPERWFDESAHALAVTTQEIA